VGSVGSVGKGVGEASGSGGRVGGVGAGTASPGGGFAGFIVSGPAVDAGAVAGVAAGATPSARSGDRSLQALSSRTAPRAVRLDRVALEDGRIGRLLSEAAAHAAVIFREPS
jgi:hypothetical protein